SLPLSLFHSLSFSHSLSCPFSFLHCFSPFFFVTIFIILLCHNSRFFTIFSSQENSGHTSRRLHSTSKTTSFSFHGSFAFSFVASTCPLLFSHWRASLHQGHSPLPASESLFLFASHRSRSHFQC
ncbi:MAG: hypothetical protein Q8P67_06010, partial [archaeon]|nr:hypothetical protein [archaeon]